MVVVKSDERNQAFTRRFLQGNVAHGFPKTKTSAPPNKNSDKNHYKKHKKLSSSNY